MVMQPGMRLLMSIESTSPPPLRFSFARLVQPLIGPSLAIVIAVLVGGVLVALLGQDPQPDHMSNYYAGPGDNQGVHINSGIPNKAFYLVASDIGTPTAGKIWYHALQNLWYNANFAEAVDVIVESARILTKNGEAPLGSTQVVRMAFKAVGL